jgi:HD-like signal output (HDOD) protein
MSEAATSSGLSHWLQRLCGQDMPVLGGTVQRLCQASEDSKTSANDLAAVVLCDASMTSGVLKIANSAYYNCGSHDINTISRAVVLLGFDAVKSIGLSLAIIDTFLRGKSKDKVIELMRQAVYAAVQAKVIAQHSGDPAPEEIFIAALLHRVGEMAFWSLASPHETEALTRALAIAGQEPKAAEMEVLGCTLRQLSAGLARHWHLGELLESSLQPGLNRPQGRSGSVLLGHELEAAVREHGWDSAAVRRITDRIAAYTRVSSERAQEVIENSRSELLKAADAFGVTLDLKTGAGVGGAHTSCAARAPDLMLQLKILRELSSLLDKKPDIQLVLDMVMEGIFRGIALDRVLLAVLAPDRSEFRVKYVLGDADNRLAERFRFKLNAPEMAFIRRALDQHKPVSTQQLSGSQRGRLLGAALREQMAEDFYLGPLVISGRTIGLIYADCRPSGQALTPDSFESFCHFIEQVNLALEHLTRR